MHSKVYLGIDPGSRGAICFLDSMSGDTKFLPTPGVFSTPLECWKAMKNILGNNIIIAAAIEDVHSIFGMSAKSNFMFGYYVGQARAVANIADVTLELVQPKVWQQAIGAPRSKDVGGSAGLKRAIGDIAKGLYPNASLYGPRGGLMDGRSDALMIAEYLQMKQKEN